MAKRRDSRTSQKSHHEDDIRLEKTLEGKEDSTYLAPEQYNGQPVINVPERRFGPSPVNKQSDEYCIHLKQMDYINKHSELKPRFDAMLTHRLMQTVHGDQRHPQQPYQDIYLLTYDQTFIHAYLLLHENSYEHYTYLICHGIRHQIEDLSSIADRFYRDFGNVLIIDYRGFGNSSGKQSERGAYIDVQTAFDYLLTLDTIDRKRIVIYGVSMGVALVIQLASEVHNSENIHACILENGFTSFKDAASEKSAIAKLLPSKVFSVGMRSIDKVHQLRVPVMYLIGLNDQMIHPKHTKQLFEATTNSKHCQLEIYADAGHTDVKDMPDYIKRSYRPFMKAVWKVYNPDQIVPQPPILVADHGKSRAVICVVLHLVTQQGVLAAAISEATTVDVSSEEDSTTESSSIIENSTSSFNLNGDPMLAGPQPPFDSGVQEYPGLESKMDPKPDYGFTSYKGSGKLEGKIAVITGGDSGIGRAVALAFAREGASIVISYLNETEDAEEIQKVIQDEGHECILISGDISEEDQCQKIINETITKFDRIDILVNNAAYQGKKLNESVEGFSHERVLYTFKTNIVSMFDLTRFAVPHMPKGSSIINVASIQAYNPNAGILDYATSKAAIVAFTKGLAEPMLEKGIRVNCVAPGPVWTPLVITSFDKEKSSQFAADSPMKRPAQPRELAPVFVFLASGTESSYVSGAIFTVSGARITA
ncbi:hypothetical protein I4U23_023484 [Adineta vaga]|nr:hypothetical protein I4U23_023484 [Adineta vaga]